MSDDILERAVIHKGRHFIEAGKSHNAAYIIQTGEIVAYTFYNDTRVDVHHFGPGDIVGESGLISDDPASMHYEAIVDTTVIKILQQDFLKTLKKSDQAIQHVVQHMAKRLYQIDRSMAKDAEDKAHVDHEALEMVKYLTRRLSYDKQKEYEDAMLPHFNALVGVVREIQQKHKLEQYQAEKKNAHMIGGENSNVDGSDEEQASELTADDFGDVPEDQDSFTDSVEE